MMSQSGFVLLTDDDAMVRETLKDLLEMDGFEVRPAANAQAAFEILQLNHAAVGILVTDLSMPGEDGIRLIQRARTLRPDLPAILLTGLAEEPACISFHGGGFHILRKPVHADDLASLITTLIGPLEGPGRA